MLHAYPLQLAETARSRWADLERLDRPGPCTLRPGALPDAGSLEQLLSVAYQASLLHEEDRPVRFRLFLGAPEHLSPDDGPPEGLQALPFAEARPYNEYEIRRLAPAAKYHRALIGVSPCADTSGFRIWGLLQSGPRWMQSARAGRAVPSPVPSDVVVVRVAGPGLVSIGVGDVNLAELRAGHLEGATVDVFEAKWLATRFAQLRSEIMAAHEQSMAGRGVPLEPQISRKISQQMIKRVIAILREAHHGGTLVMLPEARARALLGEGGTLRLKYAFADTAARRRHQALIGAIMREIALAGAEIHPRPERAGWSVYQKSHRSTIAPLDEAILEISQLLAALADVDGAVVLTDRLELLGFGAEITGALPEITRVHRALDLEAARYEVVPIDSVGTRHRSAYRLCAREPEALAIVVSHDSAVQFVAWRDGAPTYWEHMPIGGVDG
jgi:hypothetical protein